MAWEGLRLGCQRSVTWDMPLKPPSRSRTPTISQAGWGSPQAMGTVNRNTGVDGAEAISNYLQVVTRKSRYYCRASVATPARHAVFVLPGYQRSTMRSPVRSEVLQ